MWLLIYVVSFIALSVNYTDYTPGLVTLVEIGAIGVLDSFQMFPSEYLCLFGKRWNWPRMKRFKCLLLLLNLFLTRQKLWMATTTTTTSTTTTTTHLDRNLILDNMLNVDKHLATLLSDIDSYLLRIDKSFFLEGQRSSYIR